MRIARLIAASALVGLSACTTYSLDSALDDAGSDTAGDDASCAPPPAGQECATMTPCNCPGRTCIYDGTIHCADAGTKAVNEPCGTTSECGPGLSCEGPKGLQVCVPYCWPPNSTTTCDGQCVEVTASGVAFCLATCDPTNTQSCGLDSTCLYATTLPQPAWTCLKSGHSTGSCTIGSDCAGGYGCWAVSGTTGPAQCYRWCHIGLNECPGGKSCVQPTQQTTGPDGRQLGECR